MKKNNKNYGIYILILLIFGILIYSALNLSEKFSHNTVSEATINIRAKLLEEIKKTQIGSNIDQRFMQLLGYQNCRKLAQNNKLFLQLPPMVIFYLRC